MADYSEPTWPEDGQIINPKINSLELIKDPYILTNFFVQFTRSHFGDARNIVNDKYKEYIWTPDKTTSRMLIEPSFMVNLQNVQQRPAVLVKRDAVQVIPVGLGQGKHTVGLESSGRMKGFLKGGSYSVLIQGTHTLICIGQSGGEAEELGFEVFFKYIQYAGALKKEGKIGKFIVSSISPSQKVDENQENWATTINLAWTYDYHWTLYEEAPILKKIELIL